MVVVCEASGEMTLSNSKSHMSRYLLYFLVLVLGGCAVSGSLPVLSGSPDNALTERKGDFIELFDGRIIGGQISESGNKTLIVNSADYKVKDIKSYQYKGEYRTTFKNSFITRIIKGKINVYRQVINHGYNMSGGYNAGSATHHYLQKGENSKIEYFDIKTLEEMVKDNPKALDWVKQYKGLKKKNDTYLDNAISVYNK